MKFTKLNKLIATLVLSGTSVGAFATIGDTPYTLSQKNTSTTFAASSQKLAYLAVGFSMEMAYGHESEPANPTLIEVCNVKQDGSLTSCKDTGFKYNQYPNLRLVRPDTVAVNDKYIYISNNKNGQISRCTIGTHGALSACKDTGPRVDSTPSYTASGPNWIHIINGRAYVAQYFRNKVYKCDIDSNGEITNCGETGSNFVEPEDVQINGSYAYVTAPNKHQITICSVNSDGSFSNCNLQADIDLGRNYNMAFNNGIAYAPNGNVFVGGIACHNLVRKCSIAKDGTLENCGTAVTGAGIEGGFYNLYGIHFNNNYAYALNNSYRAKVRTPALQSTNSTMISKCTAATDGSLTNCQYLSGNFDVVTGIAFK